MAKAAEQRHFGIEDGELRPFVEKYNLSVSEWRDAQELERQYFTSASGEVVGRINGTHCLVRAVKPEGS